MSLFIDNKKGDFVETVQSPIIVYNEMNFAYNNGDVCVVDFSDKKIIELRMQILSLLEYIKNIKDGELYNQRIVLLRTIYSIYVQCNIINEKAIEYVRNTLNEHPVSRILSREDYRF